MAPAATIEKEELDVGEIVKQQQEKIEELTLNILQIRDEIKELNVIQNNFSITFRYEKGCRDNFKHLYTM